MRTKSLSKLDDHDTRAGERTVNRPVVITPDRVPRLIRLLRGFIGHDRLAQARKKLHEAMQHQGICGRYLAIERQPWLFALEDYDRVTRGGAHHPSTYPLEVQLLARDAKMLSELHGSMTTEVRSKYAADLLTDAHLDFAFELRTGWHYHGHGFTLDWHKPGNARGPEFRARNGDFDFDVECRRITPDFVERVKSPAVASVCDDIYSWVAERNLWGEFELEIRAGFRYDAGQRKANLQLLGKTIESGASRVDLSNELTVLWQLERGKSKDYRPDELEDMAGERAPDQMICVCSKREGDVGREPVIFRSRGPRRTRDELRDDLYDTLNRKVKTQLNPDRPGILAIKVDGIWDPTTFTQSAGIQGILGRLFEKRHLSSVIFRCEPRIALSRHETSTDTPSVIFHNPSATYPHAQRARHVG